MKIDEDLARRAEENKSFRDYQPGSATAEYNATIAEVATQIENAKKTVSDKGKKRLDNLLEWYTVKYAEWINKKNANGAGHVSVMISGPSNYNMRAHEKYLAKEAKLWEEYEKLQNVTHKISSIVAGDRIIKSDDVDAIRKLEEKLAKLQDNQEMMKAANKIIKSKKLTNEEKVAQLVENLRIKESNAKELLKGDFCGRVGFPAYALSNNNANIRSVKQRIEKLKKLAAVAEATPIEERTEDINGIQIIDNIEANRLQIIFPDKPSAEVRTELKKSGFRWSPTNGAWQAYRNSYAKAKARNIIDNIKEVSQ